MQSFKASTDYHQVVGPFDNDFGAADFQALAMYELSRRVQPVYTAILAVAPEVSSLDR